MINDITVNSNNSIELSRGELLAWVNRTLKINLTKIEQLGTGAVYCQLIDVIYPDKIQLGKVNWKAKHDYEYVNNFKVLQRAFTKLQIMKNVEIEKLVKCKYQDNLEFLQWFKKIFDSMSAGTREYDPLERRQTEHTQRSDRNLKENKQPPSYKPLQDNKNKHCGLDNEESQSNSTISPLESSLITCNQPSKQTSESKISQLQRNENRLYSDGAEKLLSKYMENNFSSQKQFYLRKFKELEHLFEEWDTDRPSAELIKNARQIILVKPETQWSISKGEFTELPLP